MMRRLGSIVAICVVLVLSVAACSPPTPSVATGRAPVTGPTVATSGTAQAAEVLAAVNAFRASQGRAALSYAPLLGDVAMRHAQDMAARALLSHEGSDGSTAAQRATRAGYGWCRIAENVAFGQKDLPSVMTAWQNSPGHRRNLLDPNMVEVGLGRVGNYWTMMLGAPGC